MLKFLLQKEFLQLRRNPFIPKLIFIFPMMVMLVMPWVMNMEVRNITVDVVDNDHSTLSAEIIHRLEASNYFKLLAQRQSYPEALEDVELRGTDLIMVIPDNFERNQKSGNKDGLSGMFGNNVVDCGAKSEILLAANSVNGTKGSIGLSYAQQIIAGNVPANVSTHFLYNRSLNYKLYMIPGLLALVVMLLCGFLPALNIVGEKEAGTIQQMNVTPVSKWNFIIAKLIPYWLIAFVATFVCLVLAWLVYDVTCQGSLLLVVLLTILMAVFFSALGLVVSNHSETMQQAIFVMWFMIIIMMLLSGIFTPVNSMPEGVKVFNLVNPMSHYIDAMRSIFIRRCTLADVAPQVITLCAFATGVTTWAMMSYRKNI